MNDNEDEYITYFETLFSLAKDKFGTDSLEDERVLKYILLNIAKDKIVTHIYFSEDDDSWVIVVKDTAENAFYVLELFSTEDKAVEFCIMRGLIFKVYPMGSCPDFV